MPAKQRKARAAKVRAQQRASQEESLTEERRAINRAATQAAREAESHEEAETRRAINRAAMQAAREADSQEEVEGRRVADRAATQNARRAESQEEAEARRAANRAATQNARRAESQEETEMRLAANYALISTARAAKEAAHVQQAIAITAASATFPGDQRMRIYDKTTNPLHATELPLPVSQETLRQIANEFEATTWTEARLVVCGVCGEQCLSEKCAHTDDSDYIARIGVKLRGFNSNRQRLQYPLRETMRVTHSEVLVYKEGASEEGVNVCNICKLILERAKATPSFGMRFDVGAVPEHLPTLSTVEKMAIQLQRPYGRILTFSFSGINSIRLSGHMISFATRQPDHIDELDFGNIHVMNELLEVHFVIPKGGTDHLQMWKNRIRGSKLYGEHLLVRQDVVLAWLDFLKYNHPLYQGIRMERPNLDALCAWAETLVEEDAAFSEGEYAAADQSDIGNANDGGEQAEQMAETFDASHIPPPADFRQSEFAAQALRAIKVSDVQEPANEYRELGGILSGAFPWLFPYGLGDEMKGPMTTDARMHLLRHPSRRFARDIDFLFYVFNLMNRVNRARCIAMSAQGMEAGVHRFFNDPASIDLLKSVASKENPGQFTDDERKALKMANELIQVSEKRNAFSKPERDNAFTQLTAMYRSLGQPSFFVTITPSAFDNKIALRFCGANDVDIPGMSYEIRSKLVLDNPVASAEFFHFVIDKVRKVLYKEGQESSGIFGKLLHYFHVVEAQQRMLLHCHALIWTDLSPTAVDQAIREERFAELANLIDNMVNTNVEKRVFDKSDAWWQEKVLVGGAGLAIDTPPYGLNDPEAIDRTDRVIHQNQIHRHKPTCSKKQSEGMETCRFGMPQPLVEHDSGPCVVFYTEEGVLESKSLMDYKKYCEDHGKPFEYPCIHISDPCNCEQVHFIKPFPITIATHRDNFEGGNQKNELITGFNPVLTHALACNTAVVQVLGYQHGRAISRYLVKYHTKDTTNITTAAVVAAERAQEKQKTRDEKAAAEARDQEEDVQNAMERDENVRTKQFINSFTNAFAAGSEYQLTIAASASLGHSGHVASVSFYYVFPWQLPEILRTVESNEVEDATQQPPADQEHDSQDDHVNFGEHAELFDEPEARTEGQQGVIYDNVAENGIDSEKVVVSQRQNYENRCDSTDSEMYKLNFIEYHQLVKVVEIKKEEDGIRRALGNANAQEGHRQRKPRFKFARPHPLHGSYEQHFGDKLFVPVLAGKPPPAKLRREQKISGRLIGPQCLSNGRSGVGPVILGFDAFNAVLHRWNISGDEVLRGRARFCSNATSVFNCEKRTLALMQKYRFSKADKAEKRHQVAGGGGGGGGRQTEEQRQQETVQLMQSAFELAAIQLHQQETGVSEVSAFCNHQAERALELIASAEDDEVTSHRS